MMKRLVIAATLVLALVGSAGTALAGANERASCLGIEASTLGPAGQVPAAIAETRAIAAELGVPMGAVISEFARKHKGSFEACFEG
jgi:hypothetical protein